MRSDPSRKKYKGESPRFKGKPRLSVVIDATKKRWIRLSDFANGCPYVLLDIANQTVVFLKAVPEASADYDIAICDSCDELATCYYCDPSTYKHFLEERVYKYKKLFEFSLSTFHFIGNQIRDLYLHDYHGLADLENFDQRDRAKMQEFVQEFEDGVPILRPVENAATYLAEQVKAAEKRGRVEYAATESHISRGADGTPIIIHFLDIKVTPTDS